MLEALQFEFMRNALWAGLLASVACGIIGTLVVVNRIVFISGGIAHAAYGGVGIAFFLGISPTFSAAVFSLVMAAVMATVTLRNKQRADTIIGVLWALGMAVGIILIDLTSGYRVDVMSYLFGSILAVPSDDLIMMVVLDVVIVAVVAFFYNGFLALSFDEEFAQTMGVPVKTLYFILLGLMALSVVMVIRVVGLILVIALLTIPPYIAEKFSVSLAWMMVFSTILSCIFSFTGLWLSYAFNLTSGATVILVASLFFFVSLLWGRARVST
ncbi:MAG: metal ABC transporter permease [Syntrophobacteraceae bacterium]|nr:metal ABC transporter permease [Syntrophobacteraceae bacterium]